MREENAYLQELLKALEKAGSALEYSHSVCREIGIKADYDQEEQDRFEALASKFGRLSDMILKKAIKTIDILDLDEPPETMRDAIARAEKKGLIQSEKAFIRIRRLRNDIAHEYLMEEKELAEMYAGLLELAPLLFDGVERITDYAKRYKT